jgi:hypothetical protein
MNFLIIGLSLLVFLVNGTDNSQPYSTEGQEFPVEFDLAEIKSIEVMTSNEISFWGWEIELEPNGDNYLQVKIPKNLPTPGEKFENRDGDKQWFRSGQLSVYSELSPNHPFEYSEDSCYKKYLIDLENQTELIIGWEVNLMGEAVLISWTIPNDCHSLGLHDSAIPEVPLFGDSRLHQTDSNLELIGVVGLMIGIIVASIGVGFYFMQKKF